MKGQPGKIGWNFNYVKGLTKEAFLAEFTPHYGQDYDLSAEYDAIVPPEPSEPVKSPKKPVQ